MLILCAVLLSAPTPRPTLAVLPPVAIENAESWLGLVVADNLSTELLRHRRAGKKKDYPLNVFSWRETNSAARAEGLDLGKPLSEASVRRLAGQLGARYVFAASYRVKGKSVLLKWRLWDTDAKSEPKEARVTTNSTTLAARTGSLVNAVLRQLGEKPAKGKAPPPLPAGALESYGRGLEILAQQSLEPHAPVVLPAMELKKARLLFEEAAKEAPQLLRAYVGSALASAMLGELERAEKDVLHALAHATALEPMNVLGLYYLYFRQQKPAEAVKTLTAATIEQPGFMGALGYLGSAHLRTGDAKQAEEVFRTYRDRVPKSPWARVMHARAAAYAGQPDAALDEMRAVYRDYPDSLMVVAALAARLTQSKKYDEAVETLERALAQHSEHPALLTRLSYVHLQKGAAPEALALAQRAVDKTGAGRGEATAGYAYANLGHALALSGKKPEALAAWKRAAELGVGIEERLLLLADERTKPLMQDPANPLATDAPPPPPAPTAESPVLPEEPEEQEEADSWEEDENWEEGDDWQEEAYDDEPDTVVE